MLVNIKVKPWAVNAVRTFLIILKIYKRSTQSYFENSNSKNSRINWWFVGNEITDRVTKISRSSSNNSLETFESKTESKGFDRVKLKEIYMSPEKRQRFIA